MLFLSHRGLWKTKEEQNSLIAFERSFNKGFGCEFDIRDRDANLVVAHDVTTDTCLLLEKVFETYKRLYSDVTLAINIKADGLQLLLKELINQYSISNYFTFDMSIADTLGYQKNQLKFFTRQSEYEPQPYLYEKAIGVFLDCFYKIWWNLEDIQQHLQQGKKVVIVSPELHGRSYQTAWEKLYNIEKELATDQLMLCTDFPEQGEKFFNG